MSTNSVLLNAILAMDAYNRGYNSGIVMPGSDPESGVGSQIGEASFVVDRGQADAQSIGFYASAYTVGSETIISYRGTDNVGLFNPFGASAFQADCVCPAMTGKCPPSAPAARPSRRPSHRL